MVSLSTQPVHESPISAFFSSENTLSQSAIGEIVVLEDGTPVLVSFMNYMEQTAQTGQDSGVLELKDKEKPKDKPKEKKSRVQLVREGKLPVYVLTPSEAAQLGKGWNPPH